MTRLYRVAHPDAHGRSQKENTEGQEWVQETIRSGWDGGQPEHACSLCEVQVLFSVTDCCHIGRQVRCW